MLDLYDLLPEAWKSELQGSKEILSEVGRRVSADFEWEKRVCPKIEFIFKPFELDPEEVRVVILGQDPYPNRHHAIGRAFAVPNGNAPIPGSLRNIFKEKIADVGGIEPLSNLESWQKQGVMLLNSSLTTIEGRSGAHRGIGWELFTERVIKSIASRGAVGLLWGRDAQRYEDHFSNRSVKGVHPSPLSAYRGFFGSKPFSRVNDLLQDPITW